jgi:predicted phage terminase large subunit-like protein
LERQKRQCEKSYYQFFLASWKTTNPTVDQVNNWHIELFCNELQRMVERVIAKQHKEYDLVINTPPKSLKSFIVSVCFPVWAWIKQPGLKFITCSYSPSLAGRDCRRSRDLINSPWFQERWSDKFKLETDSSEYYRNDKGGERRITSPRSSATGHQADVIIADDPNSADDRYSKADREMVVRWWDETMWSRLDNQDIGIRMVIQQRIDLQDLTGHIKRELKDQYKFIVLPADLSTGAHTEPVELEKHYVNGLMSPIRLSKEILAEARVSERTAYSGQYNQQPIVVGGRFFKEHWPKWFSPRQLPDLSKARGCISVDASFTDSATSCPASIQSWAWLTPNFYLLYDLTTQMSALSTLAAIERIKKTYPMSIIVVEKAANGFFIIEALKKKYQVYEFIPAKYGGKEVRAEMAAPLWETGNVYLPDTSYIKSQYFPELLAFPNSEYKDRVDSMSQALIYFTRCIASMAQFTNQGGF